MSNINTDTTGTAAAAEVAAEESEAWKTVKSLFRFGKRVGKQSFWPAIFLWALDFRAVRQGTRVGYRIFQGGLTWGQAISGEIITRSYLGLFLTVFFGVLMFWAGNNEYIGPFATFFFAGSLMVFTFYVSTVAVTAVLLIQQLKKDRDAAATEYIAEKKDSMTLSTFKIIGQVICWEALFMGSLLLIEPWQPGRMRLFLVMVLFQIGLFSMSSFTRKMVRYPAIGVAVVAGGLNFLLLVMLHLSSDANALKATKMVQSVNDVFVTASSDAYRKGVNELSFTVMNWRSIPAEYQVMDMNRDDELDVTDLAEVDAAAKDPTRLVYRTIDGIEVPLGDFNGDGKVDVGDYVFFASFLKNGTPLIADMPRRKQIANALQMEQALSKTPVQQPAPVLAHFASVTVPAREVSESQVKTVMATSSTWVEIGEFKNKLDLTTNDQINLGGYEVDADGNSSNPRRSMIPADETNLVYQHYRFPIPFGALVYLITGDAKVTIGQHFICPEGIVAYGSRVEMEGSRFRVQAMVSDSYYSDNSRGYNIAVVL